MLSSGPAHQTLERVLQSLLLGSLLLQTVLLALSEAQITLDGSLGPRRSLNGPNYQIGDELGQIRGSNLFHSFGEFNVPAGGSATFTGPTMITNILSRITGGQPSSIDGVLRSKIDGANLYLLNPSGVMFGRNASLEVKGSFYVSTADFLRFSDGEKFFATPGHDRVLTVAAPAAFGFLGSNPAPITIRGSALQVTNGKSFSLVGGDITIVGGSLKAPSGQMQLVSVASPGEVEFSPLDLAPDLQVDSFARLGRIELSQGAGLNASGNGSGMVFLRGDRLLVDGSSIFAENLGAVDGSDIGIDMQVASDAVIANLSSIGTQTVGTGRGGSITLQVGRLSISGSHIFTTSQGGASGENVTIMATDAVSIRSGGLIETASIRRGNSGRVTISAPLLSIDDGDIKTNTSFVNPDSAGDIELRVGRLTLTGGAEISSKALGAGRGGNLMITATEALTVSGRNASIRSNLTSSSDIFSSGRAGRVVIIAPTVSINDGEVLAETKGSAHGGDIELRVGQLTLAEGWAIRTSTFSSGVGGQIALTATDLVTLAGQNSGFFSEAANSGRGGDIILQTRELRLTEGAVISAFSSGAGDAGRLTITATERLRSDRSTITAKATQANGGEIALQAGQGLQLWDNSTITASVEGGPATVGGNVTIDSPYVILDGSQVIASAFEGKGGRINITGDVFLADPASTVSASSERGIQGIVDIRAPVTQLSGTLAPLPQTFVNVAALLPAPCAARLSGGKASSLVLGGRDGLPLDPGGLLPSPLVLNAPLVMDPSIARGPGQKHPTSRWVVLPIEDKVFPRMRGWSAAGTCF